MFISGSVSYPAMQTLYANTNMSFLDFSEDEDEGHGEEALEDSDGVQG